MNIVFQIKERDGESLIYITGEEEMCMIPGKEMTVLTISKAEYEVMVSTHYTFLYSSYM